MQTTEIAGFPALRTDGDADRPLVLFLHGAFTSHQCFARWLSAFEARGWRCIAPSLRGRLGLPPPNAEGVTLWQYLEDARRILDTLGEKPAIVGHSVGGLLAQKLAEEDRCAAAVLMSPAPPVEPGAAGRHPAGAGTDAAQHHAGPPGAPELLERGADHPQPPAATRSQTCLQFHPVRIRHLLPGGARRLGACGPYPGAQPAAADRRQGTTG